MDLIKSARRVLEFLEYFSRVQRAVTVAELAHHYGYPNSSVSAVMRTMVGMGYLHYDTRARTYLPTTRLPFLVEWIGTQLYDSDAVRSIMQDLSDATGETIILGVQSGIRIQYVRVIDGTGAVRLHAKPGSFREFFNTAIGQILLSHFDDAHAGRLIRRINNEQADPAKHADVAVLLADLRTARAQGYIVSIGGVVARAGAIAALLPKSFGPTPLAIAISSVESVILSNRDAYADLIKATIAKHQSPNLEPGERGDDRHRR